MNAIQPKQTISAVAVLLLFTMLSSCAGDSENARFPTPPAIAGLRFETVSAATAPTTLDASGTVRAKVVSVLSAKVPGNIISIPVQEGDQVRLGQTVFIIDSRDTAAQLRQAQAGLDEARAGLSEVDRGIQAAELAAAAARANSDLALATRERYTILRERRSISPQEFDEVDARYKVATAEADRAKQSVESMKSKRSQNLARIDQAEAALSGAQIALGYSRVVSPVNGIVSRKFVDIGALASPGVPVVSIEGTDAYQLEVSVDESQIARIHRGDRAILRIDASANQAFEAKVAEIVPAPDASSRAVTLRLDIPSSISNVRSGFFGRASFTVGSASAVTVPNLAVVRRGQLTAVFVKEDGVARMRLIRTGKNIGDRVEVLSGLHEGDTLIVNPEPNMPDGAEVKP